MFFSFTLLSIPQMVSSSFDPFLPTAAELAGDASVRIDLRQIEWRMENVERVEKKFTEIRKARTTHDG